MDEENKTIDAEVLLREARDLKVDEIIIPAIVLTVVVAVIGIIPNCVAVTFYGFKTQTKSSSNLLITALAVCDFIVSMYIFVFLIDFTNIYYSRSITCKIAYFSAHCVVSLSTAILWLISINRYFTVCFPFGGKIKTFFTNTTFIKIALFCLFIFTLVFSMRDLWLYDAIQFNVTVATRNASVIGRFCTNTDDPDRQTVIAVFHIIDIICCVFVVCTFAFTYGRIWWTVRQQKNKNTGGSKEPSWSKIEKRMSKMMFFVSVGFVVCFVPYFVAMIMLMNSDKRGIVLKPWYRVIIRIPVLNSIINPSIYCMSDPKFRTYLKSLSSCVGLKKNSDEHSVSVTHGEQVNDPVTCSSEL